jgi:hypothetical protein
MAEKDKEKDTRSSRTKWLDSLPDNAMTTASRKISRLGDAVGFTQEEQYKDKKYQVPETQKKKAGGWIKGAIKKPGALRASLGVKKGEKIPAAKLAAAAKKPGKMGQRARLAQTLKGLKK